MRVSTVRCGMWRTYGPKIKNQIGERVDTKQTVGHRKITFRDNITLRSKSSRTLYYYIN